MLLNLCNTTIKFLYNLSSRSCHQLMICRSCVFCKDETCIKIVLLLVVIDHPCAIYSNMSCATLQAVFAGHNHGLDWCCPYKNLWLCFARHTGYGGYGDWPRGSRILSMTEQPLSIESWIRMEDGTKHSHVILSS